MHLSDQLLSATQSAARAARRPALLTAARLAEASAEADADSLGIRVLQARAWALLGQPDRAGAAAAAAERWLQVDSVPAWLSYGPVDLHAVRKEMWRVVLAGGREF